MAVLALTAAGPASAASKTVSIFQDQVRFEPSRVAVKPGDSVTWNNQDTHDLHTVTFDDGTFRFPTPPATEWTTTSRTFATEGVYAYHCEIHGNSGGTGMSGVVYVNPTEFLPPAPPTASFVAPDAVAVGQNVFFDGSASKDVDGTIVKFEWDLNGDGSYETDTRTTPGVSHSYTTPGTLTVRLRVTDNQGLMHVKTRPLTIIGTPPIVRPTPAIVPAPTVAALPPALPSFASSRRSVTVSRSGRFSYTFRATPGLTGTIKLASTRTVRVGAKRRVSLPGKRFTVPAAGKVTVKMKLSRRNLKILKRNRKIRFRAKVEVRNAAGLARSSSARVTLKKPRGR